MFDSYLELKGPILNCFMSVVIYMGFGEISQLQFDIKFVTRDIKWAVIHNDLSENMLFQLLHCV